MLSNYSLEITTRDLAVLERSRPLLPSWTRISITALPGESDDARIAAARAVARMGFVPIPHVAARSLRSRAALENLLERLHGDAGVDALFLIAGDIAEAAGEFPDALSVIRSGLLPKFGMRAVGIAGYPEGHPRISREILRAALRDKIATGRAQGLACDIVTQFGFDSAPIFAWLEELRADGIGAPVRIGVAGPTSVRGLLRYAARCGVAISAKAMTRYGVSVGRLLTTATPDSLLRQLHDRLDPERHGEIEVHLYPFGGIADCIDWARAWKPRHLELA